MQSDEGQGKSNCSLLESRFFSEGRGHAFVELFPADAESSLQSRLERHGWVGLTVRPSDSGTFAIVRTGADGSEIRGAAEVDHVVRRYWDEVIVVDAFVIGRGRGDLDRFILSEGWLALRPRVMAVALDRSDAERLTAVIADEGYVQAFRDGSWQVLCRREDGRVLLPFLQGPVVSQRAWAEARVAALTAAITDRTAALDDVKERLGATEAERLREAKAAAIAARQAHERSLAAQARAAAMEAELRGFALRLARIDPDWSESLILHASPETASLGAGRAFRRRLGKGFLAASSARGRVERMLAARTAIVADSGLFEPAWYLSTYPDVAASAWDALRHFVEHGTLECRDPGPGFSTRSYLESYPDVAASHAEPFLHYLIHGRKEQRFGWRNRPMDG